MVAEQNFENVTCLNRSDIQLRLSGVRRQSWMNMDEPFSLLLDRHKMRIRQNLRRLKLGTGGRVIGHLHETCISDGG